MCVAAAESSEPSALPWLCPLLESGPEVAGSEVSFAWTF